MKLQEQYMNLEKTLKDEYAKKFEELTKQITEQQDEIELEREVLRKKSADLERREVLLLQREKEVLSKQKQLGPEVNSSLEHRFKDVCLKYITKLIVLQYSRSSARFPS